MTSAATRKDTQEFFRTNSYFGLDESQVTFFNQGLLPCFDNDGKMILADKGKVAMAPDGNGGLYRGMQKAGVLEQMEAAGIEHLHVYCVDNCLVRVADPLFLAFANRLEADAAAKVVDKTDPHEAVGVLCRHRNAVQVVEYSEITSKTAEARAEDGRLAFRAGNIANHYFRRFFLQSLISQHLSSLRHHVARKKIPYVDISTGQQVKPSAPNGIKMELFVFDVFQFSERFGAWSVAREEEFAPLKNADSAGKDCASTARQAIHSLHRYGIKMELFVFDVFQFSERFGAWSVAREEEFAPLKNADSAGKDCASTARQAIHNLHRYGIKMELFVFDVFQFSERFGAWSVAREEEFAPLKNADSAGKDCASTARQAIHSLHRYGIKMELFVFDVFQFSERFGAWSVAREEEFAPLKNADSAGKDCASTARQAIHSLHRYGIKMELFVFDVFQFSERFGAWSVAREEEFAPLKNADSAGKDCASTARQAIHSLHRSWLEKAGATVLEHGGVEISPLLSYAGEGLEAWAGRTVHTPLFLLPDSHLRHP